jgi:hypothetical protein
MSLMYGRGKNLNETQGNFEEIATKVAPKLAEVMNKDVAL